VNLEDDDTTALLAAWSAGDEQAGARLTRRLYPELRRIAARQLASAPGDITLQPTELVNEAFLRLVDQQTAWKNRAHFFAIAARVIRRVLANQVRDRRRQKRGGGAVRVSLEDEPLAAPEVPPDVVALDEALGRLEQIDETACRVVELRYFGGLTIDETAQVLAVGRATVVRAWRYARAWLKDDLTTSGVASI
jgi:RNA polymerase sigma factor (TIGR02999 family)